MQRLSMGILLFLVLAQSLSATNIASTTQDIRAFVLPQDHVSIRASLKGINDGLDILNLNDSPLLDESKGMDFSIAYGVHPHVSLYYNFEALNIDYAKALFKNRQHDLYARINFYDNPLNVFDDFSLDVGLTRNSSGDFSSLFSDIHDHSYYLRLLWGNRLPASLFNVYTGIKYTSINTDVSGVSYDYTRNEKALTFGITSTLEFSRLIFDTHYQYIRLFGRDSQLTEYKSNHILHLNLSTPLSNNLLLYIGDKIMLHQFNGLIPYLYNRYTQDSFDDVYHYLNLGFVYNFPICR